MTNNFLNGLSNSNTIYTENGALTRDTTGQTLLDMFALGGAYRSRTDSEVLTLFWEAYKENPVYALKCLFYLRDREEGQGERRFFRVCLRYLARNDSDTMRRNMEYIPFFGRWDDLYSLVNTPLENEMFQFMKKQLALDMESKTPSLLAKWLKSENASSHETIELAKRTRNAFGMTAKQYRKTLSILRERINVLERLMSSNQWDKIEFDKIPSRAGMIYKNAFARHDVERKMAGAKTYEDFAKDSNSKVNAKVLYPYECVAEAFKRLYSPLDDTQRLMTNKYWDNLRDYFNGATFNALAVVDTSGSMMGTPMNVAISLGLYTAEKAKGPFAGHFMTFSSSPTLVKVQGVDFVEKVNNMRRANWGGSTNIEAAFDLMLYTAQKNHCSQDELPENLIIISDMEFDACATSGPATSYNGYYGWYGKRALPDNTLFETMEKKWNAAGYKFPKLIFWNVDARQNNIPMRDTGYVSYVSGFSSSIFQSIMTGKTAADLMYEKLDSERYAPIH